MSEMKTKIEELCVKYKLTPSYFGDRIEIKVPKDFITENDYYEINKEFKKELEEIISDTEFTCGIGYSLDKIFLWSN